MENPVESASRVNLFLEASEGLRGGENAKFQSVFLHEALLGEHYLHSAHFDKALVEFVNWPVDAAADGENERNLECDAHTVASLFHRFLPNKPSSHANPATIQNCINLASDLALMKTGLQRAAPPPPSSQQPQSGARQLPSSSASSSSSSSSSSQRGAPHTQPTGLRPSALLSSASASSSSSSSSSSAAAPSRGGAPPAASQEGKPSFRSGRDVFLESGGKFAPPPPPPSRQQQGSDVEKFVSRAVFKGPQAQGSGGAKGGGGGGGGSEQQPYVPPPGLEHLDAALVEKIERDILQHGAETRFSDIAGLAAAKQLVLEMVMWPIINRNIFTGIRKMPNGTLLFGPPGTGKTLIGRAVATECRATFFCISASSLLSKWIGEGEKTVRTLFAVAAHYAPSVVFLDEVDSLLSQRTGGEGTESSSRIKTEFFQQLDGAATDRGKNVTVLAATNRPEEIDEAARRRFVKRIYIPLPCPDARAQLVQHLLRQMRHTLSADDVTWLVAKTDGFSGADMTSLCQEASMVPVREMAARAQQAGRSLEAMREGDIAPLCKVHFRKALRCVGSSVSPQEIVRYEEWNRLFGRVVGAYTDADADADLQDTQDTPVKPRSGSEA